MTTIHSPLAPDRCKAATGDITLSTYTADPSNYDAEAEMARLLAIHEVKLKEAMSDPTKLQMGQGPDVILGFDTETSTDPVTGTKETLSLQLHLIGEGGELSRIFYARGGVAPSLVSCTIKVLLEALEKGKIKLWPAHVIVCAYFMRADLGALPPDEFDALKSRVDNAGGRISTVGSAITYSVMDHQPRADPGSADDTDAEPSGTPRRASAVVGIKGQMRLLQLVFRDIAGHVAMGKCLADVGDQIGVPKVDIGSYDKARMDILLAQDKPLFERYAMTDALICARFMAELRIVCAELTGTPDVPPTASGMAQRFCLKTMKDAGLSREACFGVMAHRSPIWSEKADKVRTRTTEVRVPGRDDHAAFVTKCYHGGMNSAFYMGPTPIGTYFDWDLTSAYSTAMLSIPLIDFDNPVTTTKLEDFMGDVIGFAHVDFEYPQDFRYPGLPVDGAHRGLLYPRKGSSYCTAAELSVAAMLGCQIKVRHGVIFLARTGEEIRIFEPFVREGRRLRAMYPKGSVQEQYMKLVLNSAYGRLAQGLKEKTVFDTRSAGSVPMPQSAITNEVMAAQVTGRIRATLAEIAGSLRPDRRLYSITTDGFISDASLNELPLDGPMVRRFAALSMRATGVPSVLEEKHRARQVIIMRTRGQITTEIDPTAPAEKRTILAKVGVSPPSDVLRDAHNEYMVDLYLHRTPGQQTTNRPFVSTRAQWTAGMQFGRLERTQRLNLEPDLKNRLVNPHMVRVRGMEHVACDTVPWDLAEEGLAARALFDGWTRKNCLQNLDDWASWQAALQFGVARRAKRQQGKPGAGIHMTEEGPLGLLRRMFMRAWTRKLLGITPHLSASKLAAWLTTNGMPTTLNDVKNASRSTHRFEEGVIPRSPEVIQGLAVLAELCPGAELDRLLVPAA